MSRCFPFPPPGYERKLITDDPDLLKKEKHREKKHKKDKKEKKDRKEKKEKDRSEGRHKEKKDKHRDKKKDKEKSETSGSLDIYGQPKGFNGELIHHNNGPNKEKINGDLLINKIKVGDSENCKFVQDLDRRIRDEERGTSSHQFVVQKTDGLQMGGNVAVPSRVSGSNMVVPGRVNGSTPVPLDNRRIEKKVERDKNKQIMKTDLENSYLGVGNEGNTRKRRDMENNGVSHEKELRPNKMARPVSNISPENGKKLGFSQNPGQSLLDKPGASHPHNSFKVGSKGGQKVNGMITAQPASVPAKKPPIPASPIKSPPVTTNHHVPTRSAPVPTSKPQPNHIASAQPSTSKPPPLIPKPVTPHRQPHHLSPSPPPPPPPPTTSQQPPVHRPKPPPPPPLPIPKKKPPHPDTKYLNQILSVPKLDQWCGFPDQEWLYNSKAGPAGPISQKPIAKKPPVMVPEVQVWSEAKHIESADVFALPYVIPY